jgi:curved DNA-binding protein CbpA
VRSPHQTHYQLLMIAERADIEIISAAYKILARRHHPDLHPGPESAQLMAQLNEAYDTLRNPAKRATYDAQLAARRDRRSTDRLVRRPGTVPYGGAGRPIGPPHGSLIDFGRYSGWTLGQIRRHDPDFLHWLMSVPGGRQYRDEIASLLQRRAS